MTYGVLAILGFGFSFAIARLFSPEEVGTGTSLIAATSVIAYLSLFGLNVTIVRYFATSLNRNLLITQSLFIVGILGLLFSAGYVVLAPVYASELSFVRDNPLFAAGFLVAGLAASMNLLTDFIFIAARKSEYNLLVDGLLQGLTKLALPFGLVGLGAYGIFASAGAAYLVALVLSMVCIWRVMAFRVEITRRPAISRAQFNYSIFGYVSSVLSVAPIMVLPLIALQTLGKAEAGYFFLAFQVANTVYGTSYAIGEAFFAEGSFDESRLGSLLKRSAFLMLALQVPAVVVMGAGSELIMSFFGESYGQNGAGLLRILAFAGVAVALNTWACYLLKLVNLMRGLLVANVVCTAVILGLAQLWGGHGLESLGWAFLVGNATGGACAVLFFVAYRRKGALSTRFGRHRRDDGGAVRDRHDSKSMGVPT